MIHPFSLAHLTVLGCAPHEMVYMAARIGYDFVSLRLIPMGVPGESILNPADKQSIRKTRTALRETGMGLLDIELARIVSDVEPEQYLPAFETGAELGARHIISSAWTNDRTDRNFLVERYAKICELASPFNMTVDLEFPTFSRLATLTEAADIVRAADCENRGILLDTLYFHFSGISLDELSGLPQEWFHFLHISDTVPKIPATREGKIHIARDDRRYVGEGCIDFKSILNHFPDIPLSIELPNTERTKALGYEGHAKRCLETAKKHLKTFSLEIEKA